jgi:uncharacterized protein YndB with AHSA1/START domain
VTERLEESIDVAAPPQRVYDLVADLTRMGEWSPECVRCDWLGGATAPRPGARFKGRNRNGRYRWSTTGTILTAEPGKELAWESRSLGLAVAEWRYQFRPDDKGGTTVTESTEDRRGRFMRILGPIASGVRDRGPRNTEGMRATLQRLKAAAERSG